MTLRRAAVAAAAGLVLAAPAAQAHDGVGASFKGRTGHYTVYAYDGFPAPGAGLTYRLVLLDHVRGGPAYDVRVTGTARQVGGSRTASVGPGNVQVYGNVAYLTLPDPYPADWTVRLALAGDPGRSSISFRVHGLAPDSRADSVVSEQGTSGGAPGWLVLVGVVVATSVTVGVVVRRRRRST